MDKKIIINCSPWRGPFCFHKRGEDTKMRSSWECLFVLSAPDWHLQSGCITSIARPFAVRIPPHYATVTHGWVTHPGLARDARVTTFTLSSVMTRGTWLPRRTYPAVPRGAHRTWWDKYTEKPHTVGPGDSKYVTSIAVGITCLSVSKLKDLQNWRNGHVTHLEALPALVPQPLFDPGFPSHPSNRVLLQKCALVWRIPAIKLYQYPVKVLPFTPSTPRRPGCPGWPGFPLGPIIPGRPLGPWGPVRPGGPGDPGWLWHLVQPLCWLPSNNEGSSTRMMTIKEGFRPVLEAHNLLYIYICIWWHSLRRISLQICRMWLSDTSPAWNKECCAFSWNSHSCVTIKSPY